MQGLYTEGLDHMLSGHLKRAYQCFKGVIDRDTDHISAYMKLGQVMRRSGAADRALQLHESLLARPDLAVYERVELLKNLARDHSDLDQYGQAVERALDILKLEKRNIWALRMLVMLYRNQGDWESAGKYLAQWQKAVGREDTRLLALCRFRQGYDKRREDDPETVRGHYRQALKINGEFATAQHFLAESYADEARSCRSGLAAAETAGQGMTDRERQELVERIDESYSRAVVHWSAFVELSPADAYMVLPSVEEALFYLQRFDDMEPFLRKVLDKDPENLDGVAGLANFYVRKGDLDRAEELLGTIPEGATDRSLIRAIELKLTYRRNADQNLMPELDRLLDAIRLEARLQVGRRDTGASLMSWLDPSSDPLEVLE